MTAFTRVRLALQRESLVLHLVRPGQVAAVCPACKRYVVYLTAIEGSALIHCFGGCTDLEVMRALGMDCRHLYDRIGYIRYTYTDHAGKPTRHVHRKIAADGSKTFWQKKTPA